MVGFDDISSAAYQNPRLTTVHQPLREMGEIAARTLLRRLAGEETAADLTVEPQLVVRESTAPARPPLRGASWAAVSRPRSPCRDPRRWPRPARAGRRPRPSTARSCSRAWSRSCSVP